MSRNRIDIARELSAGFASADREAVEQVLSPDFTFSAPPDPLLDRDGYFERCCAGAGSGDAFEFVRLDGGRGRNTQILTFDGGQIARAGVYFGWDVR